MRVVEFSESVRRRFWVRGVEVQVPGPIRPRYGGEIEVASELAYVGASRAAVGTVFRIDC